jgi:hypothetical protein
VTSCQHSKDVERCTRSAALSVTRGKWGAPGTYRSLNAPVLLHFRWLAVSEVRQGHTGHYANTGSKAAYRLLRNRRARCCTEMVRSQQQWTIQMFRSTQVRRIFSRLSCYFTCTLSMKSINWTCIHTFVKLTILQQEIIFLYILLNIHHVEERFKLNLWHLKIYRFWIVGSKPNVKLMVTMDRTIAV